MPTSVADVPVLVDRSIQDLVVPLQPAGRVIGRVVIDPSGPAIRRELLPMVPITFWPIHGDLGPIPYSGIGTDGQFTSVGLPPGRYQMAVGTALVPGLDGWFPLKEIAGRRVNLIDIGAGDTHVTVTLTTRQTRLSGTVRDAAGRPLAGTPVVVFPRDPSSWTDVLALRLTSDRDGRFDGARIRPGDYLVAAVRTVPKTWQAPEYFGSLVGRATPVTLQLGEQRTVNLTPISR
jgi:hypothetical protein